MRNTFVTTGLLGVLILTTSPLSRAQESQSGLIKRIGDLEQKVTTLERLLSSRAQDTSATVLAADEKLAAAEQQLHYTERLHKRGYVTRLQLEANRFAVAKARKELQLAKAQKDKRTLLEIDILTAEQNLVVATERSQYRERLWAKGYVTESQVKADRLVVEKARKELENAKAKLKMNENSLKEVMNQAPNN